MIRRPRPLARRGRGSTALTLESALIACGRDVDRPALRSLVYRLHGDGVPPIGALEVELAADDATAVSPPASTAWSEASARLAVGMRLARAWTPAGVPRSSVDAAGTKSAPASAESATCSHR